MLVVLLYNHKTEDATTVHMHTLPRKGEIITLHDEDDKIDYEVTTVRHFAYTPNESHQYAAKIEIVPDGFQEWY